MSALQDITIVILAGGRGRRMGGEDKGLIPYRGKPLIEHALAHLPPGPNRLLISANRNLERYARYGEVVEDPYPDHPGPLAGILAAMERSDSDYLLTLPCDSPDLPDDLAQRLLHELEKTGADIAVASCGERQHFVIALLKTRLAGDLRDYLEQGGRRVGEWQRRHKLVYVPFVDCEERFRNINTPEELEDRL